MKTNTFMTRCGLGAVALSLVLAGCAVTASDKYPTPSKANAQLNEKTVKFKGTVVYHHQDGGYYTLVSDNGHEYAPLNLASAYRKGGLRVTVHGETRGYARNGEMRALEIFDIAAPYRE
jgi:hypothetical protein